MLNSVTRASADDYVARLALIPAVFGFVGACLVGVVVPGSGVVRAPIFDGLFGAILGYVMSCATVLVLGLFIEALAPIFGGRRNFDSAFKLAVYSYTPVWLAGIFLLAPGFASWRSLAFYGAYICCGRADADDESASSRCAVLRRANRRLRRRAHAPRSPPLSIGCSAWAVLICRHGAIST